MPKDELIAAYNARRDKVLAADDLERFIQFAGEQGQHFSTPLVAMICMRKMQTACVGLPAGLRLRARQWLLENGFEPWD